MENKKLDVDVAAQQQQAIRNCVQEMYLMQKGEFIERPDEIVLAQGDGYITRKQIKHIIESRMGDNHSGKDIEEILLRIPEVILRSDYELVNKNPRYPESILRIKVFKGWKKGMVIVMDAIKEGRRAIITVYPRSILSAYFLLLKQLHASAAGEAPNPKDILVGNSHRAPSSDGDRSGRHF